MKLWRAAMAAMVAGVVLLAALCGLAPAAAAQQVKELNPPPNPMQTQGKVGDTYYRWTNGRAWLSLGDNAKVAMVAGIEQGLILSVRENWGAVPKPTRQTLVKTAGQVTVGGITFNQLVLQIDNFYLMPGNLRVPVVDAYLYALSKLKGASKGKLEGMVKRLRKTYPMPPTPNLKPKH